MGDHDEGNGNFIQLLKLQGRTDPRLNDWLDKKAFKYVSHDIQNQKMNECIQIMTLSVLRQISRSLSNGVHFCVMADEITDSSNREQLVVCLRWVDDVQEDFLGLYQVPNIASDTVVKCLRDVLIRMNLNIDNCRGQCYDEASNMKGHKKGVATQILQEEGRALYTHCYGHSLNLAIADTVREIKLLQDTLDTTSEISKLLKYSPKRNTMFVKLKEELAPRTPGFRTLCPTRWTVRAISLSSTTIFH